MKTRTDLLNHLADKYNLQRYLEIGVQDPTQNFDKINCAYKIGVDPDPAAHATYCMNSDDFFTLNANGSDTELGEYLGARPLAQFELVFIDGLHTAEQVKKDFENALKVLSPKGFIVLHDCNPKKEEHTIVPRPTPRGHWNGDVYKFAATLQTYSGIKGYTVDIDNGCAVVQQVGDIKQEWSTDITWSDFDSRRKYLLNLITWDEFIAVGSHV